MVGNVAFGVDADQIDGFMINAPQSVEIAVDLSASNQTSDLDVLIVDPISLQTIFAFDSLDALSLIHISEPTRPY